MVTRSIHDLIASCRKCEFVDKPFCTQRVYERFLPKRLRVLVVSESPPPGQKPDYLYNLSHPDRLRRVLAKTFGTQEAQLTSFLVKHGIFWTTAVKCRPPSKKEVEAMRKNCLEVLRLELEKLKPKRVVALGKVALNSLGELGVTPAGKHHHPLYLARFRRRELGILKDLILG